MSLSVGVLFGIIALLGWGVADFVVAGIRRSDSPLQVLFFSQLVSAVILTTLLGVTYGVPTATTGVGMVLLGAALLGTTGYAAYYTGLQCGKVTLVSPIAASRALITVIGSLLLLGEHLSGLQSIAVGAVIVGTVLSAFRWEQLKEQDWRRTDSGVGYALITMMVWGFMYILLDVAVAELGWLAPVTALKIVLVGVLGVYLYWSEPAVTLPAAPGKIAIIGVLEATAIAAYGFGVSIDATALVAPISAAYPMVTVILVWWRFDESIDTNQWIGIGMILTALVLLTL